MKSALNYRQTWILYNRLITDLSKAFSEECQIEFGHSTESEKQDNLLGEVYQQALDMTLITQEWIDDRLKNTSYELLNELQMIVFNSWLEYNKNPFQFYFNSDTIEQFSKDILTFTKFDCEWEDENELKEITTDLAEQILHHLKEYNYENSK